MHPCLCHPDWGLDIFSWLEAAMYVVIRKFTKMRSVAQAARRAESGIGQILKQAPGFRGYYVFDGGNGVGCSITLFENRADALAATLSTTSAAAGIAAARVAARVRRVIFV
jgi:hypothetical protein